MKRSISLWKEYKLYERIAILSYNIILTGSTLLLFICLFHINTQTIPWYLILILIGIAGFIHVIPEWKHNRKSARLDLVVGAIALSLGVLFGIFTFLLQCM